MYWNHKSPLFPWLSSGALTDTNFTEPPHFGTLALANLVLTHAQVAAIAPFSVDAGVGTSTVPVNVGLLFGARLAVILPTHDVVGICKFLVTGSGSGA